MIKELKIIDTDLSTGIERDVLSGTDALIIRDLIEPSDYEKPISALCSDNGKSASNLNTFPLPYSVIHSDSNERLDLYFNESAKANHLHERLLGKANISKINLLLEKIINSPIGLLNYKGNFFSKFNYREAKPSENYGIEIHCENAFLHQLYPGLRKFLYDSVDIENMWSYFIVLSEPEQGGALMLFPLEWKDYNIDTSRVSDNDKRDPGLFFNDKTLREVAINLKKGDFVIFRAGQLWHSIDRIGGKKNRMTVGGFIAKKTEGEGYYQWS